MVPGKSWYRRHLRIDALILGVLALGAGVACAQGGKSLDHAAAASPTPKTAQEANTHGPAREDLNAFLQGVHTFAADFTQEIRDATGKVIKRAAGSVDLARPHRFRWAYTQPYRQLVVADGKTLWIYDAQLEQASRAPLDGDAPSSPAMLLSGSTAVQDKFNVIATYTHDGLDFIKLAPKSPDSGFRDVVIGFDGTSPRRLEFRDSLNQLTVIDFTHVKLNPKLKSKVFQFDPPRGVDVIGGGKG